MIRLKIEGLEEVKKWVELGGKNGRIAAKRALNNAAFDLMKKGRAHIAAGINASRWTETAWYVRKKAETSNLTASVGWSDYLANKRGHAAEYYLSQHWTGGTRQHKAFETRLIRANLMPAGMYAVPGKAAGEMKMLDARGNFKGSALVQIMSNLGAFIEAGYNANANQKRRSKVKGLKSASRHVYWAGKPGPNTPLGIWAMDENYGNGRGRLRPVIVFVKRVNYKKRLSMDSISSSMDWQKFESDFWAEFKTASAWRPSK